MRAEMRLLIVNGPNLNLLGEREPALYGRGTLAELEAALVEAGRELGGAVDCVQSNHEGELVELIHAARHDRDGLIINLGGYTHTSVALRDALLAVGLPFVEVHLTNLAAREDFRRRSLMADLAIGIISGFGALGYHLALQALADHLTHGEAHVPDQ